MRVCFCILSILIIPSAVPAQYDHITYYSNGYPKNGEVSNEYGRIGFEWDEAGNIRSKTWYTQQGAVRAKQEYYPNGIISLDSAIEQPDFINSRHYHSNGQLASYYYHSNAYQRRYSPVLEEYYQWNETGHVVHGYVRDTSGNVMLDRALNENEFADLKLLENYYPDSMLRQQGFYKLAANGDTLKYGAWMSFFANGKLANIGYWNDNVKWGAHYTLNDSGAIVSVEHYEHGEPVRDNREFSIYGKWENASETYGGQWRKWCWDGLERQMSGGKVQMHYMYKGLMVCGIPSSDDLKRKTKDIVRVFSFPYMEYWSTWNYYRVGFHRNGTLHQRSFSVDGSWGFFEVYDDHGIINYQRPGANMRENSFWANGVIMQSILKEEIPCNTDDCNSNPRVEVDTAYYYSPGGVLNKKIIYGWNGGIRETWELNGNGEWEITVNKEYCALYVEFPNGKRTEIKTRGCTISGKWILARNDGLEIELGTYANGREGEWKTYYPDGTLASVRRYHNGHSVAGYSTAFYPNGKMREEGWLDGDGEKIGVWKFFDEGGQMNARYFLDKNGDQWGLVFDGCYHSGWSRKCRGAWGIAIHNFRIMFAFPRIRWGRPRHRDPYF